MICFAGIVPHPVLSVPTIGKATSAQLPTTLKALKQIKQELYASKPDTLLIFSPHVKGPTENLTLNQNHELIINFRDFGDFSPYFKVRNNLGLGYRLRERVETSIPMVAAEAVDLDHGTAVPLFHFLDKITETSVISVGTAADLDVGIHFKCGQLWRKPLDLTNERVAVIASADLSHDTKDHPQADTLGFDRKVIHWIEQRDTKALLALPADNPLVQSTCGLRPIALLLGLMAEQAYSVQSISFERTLSIGYYSALFRRD